MTNWPTRCGETAETIWYISSAREVGVNNVSDMYTTEALKGHGGGKKGKRSFWHFRVRTSVQANNSVTPKRW